MKKSRSGAAHCQTDFADWKSIPRGFSLIEIAIALGILSFVMIGLVSLLSVSLTSARESNEETARSLILKKMLADLQLSGPNAGSLLQSSASNSFDLLGRYLTNAGPPPAGAYYLAGFTNVATNGAGCWVGQVLIRAPWPQLKTAHAVPFMIPQNAQ